MSIRKLSAKSVTTFVEYAISKKQPAFIHGTMGIGKSSVVKQIAKKLGREFIDIRLSQIDQTDLRGMPFFNTVDQRMHWAPPIELPTDPNSNAIIFLDEMNAASPSVSAAAYQLILDRKIGTYTLPPNVVIVAAGNINSDSGIIFKMPAPLANRFIHCEMVVNYDSWLTWAIENRINSQVIGYLSDNKQELHNFKSISPDEKAFATPRTWEFVSNLLGDDISEDTMTDLLSGTIGEGLAVKFLAHRNRTFNLPKPMDILTGKVLDLETSDISAKYSLVTSLCYLLKDEKDNADSEVYGDNFIQYLMKNMETEFVVMGVRVALKNFQIDFATKSKGWVDFSKKYSKILTDIHKSQA